MSKTPAKGKNKMNVTFEMMEKAQSGMDKIRTRRAVADLEHAMDEMLLGDSIKKWESISPELRKKMIAGIEMFICDLSQRLTIVTEAFVYDPEDTVGQIRKELESVVAARDLLWFAGGEQR